MLSTSNSMRPPPNPSLKSFVDVRTTTISDDDDHERAGRPAQGGSSAAAAHTSGVSEPRSNSPASINIASAQQDEPERSSTHTQGQTHATGRVDAAEPERMPAPIPSSPEQLVDARDEAAVRTLGKQRIAPQKDFKRGFVIGAGDVRSNWRIQDGQHLQRTLMRRARRGKQLQVRGPGLDRGDESLDCELLDDLREVYADKIVVANEKEIKVVHKALQKFCLEYYEARLAEVALSLRYDKSTSSAILIRRYQNDMKDYIAALEIMERMNAAYKTHRGREKFEPSTKWSEGRELLRDISSRWRTSRAHELSDEDRAKFDKDMEPLQEYLETTLDPPLDRYMYNEKLRDDLVFKFFFSYKWPRFLKKVFAATVGGTFLVFPMLIMVLHPGLTTSLVTTSVCVFMFGVIISCVASYVEPKDVMSVTAAYAAVLVVFVGTNSASS